MQGGVKRGREDYERREKNEEEPEEPAAPIPGAFFRRTLRFAGLSTLRASTCCPAGRRAPIMYRRRKMLSFSLPCQICIVACRRLTALGQDGRASASVSRRHMRDNACLAALSIQLDSRGKCRCCTILAFFALDSSRNVPLHAGGFKSVKARWMSFYENEQKAHGDGRPPRPLTADNSDVHKRSAAEPLGPQPTASAPPHATEAWRKDRRSSPSEAAGVQGGSVEYDCSSAQQHSEGVVPPGGQKADSKHAPQAAGPATEAGPTGTKRQKVATPAAGVSGHSAAAQASNAAVRDLTAEQGSQSPAKAAGAPAQEADLKPEDPATQPSDTGQHARPERKAIQPQGLDNKSAGGAASKAKAGKAAAIHDAAASYAAASKAHSSMQEPLSPKTEPAARSAVQKHASMKDKVEAVKAEAVMSASAAAITAVTVQQQHSAAAQDRSTLQRNAESASASQPKGTDRQQRSQPLQDAAAGSAAPSAYAGMARRHPCMIDDRVPC